MIEAELNQSIEAKVREAITDRILREANIDAQVASAIAAIEKPSPAVLAEGIRNLFQQQPHREWRDHIEAIASERAGEVPGDDASLPDPVPPAT